MQREYRENLHHPAARLLDRRQPEADSRHNSSGMMPRHMGVCWGGAADALTGSSGHITEPHRFHRSCGP